MSFVPAKRRIGALVLAIRAARAQPGRGLGMYGEALAEVYGESVPGTTAGFRQAEELFFDDLRTVIRACSDGVR